MPNSAGPRGIESRDRISTERVHTKGLCTLGQIEGNQRVECRSELRRKSAGGQWGGSSLHTSPPPDPAFPLLGWIPKSSERLGLD